MTEQGPFKPDKDLKLQTNPYAWNTVSNMVFIESPAGVGFSYSDDKADYTTGDAQTAIDNYNLIQAFFKRFPEYSNSDLYISSESYGGHYMPTLAKQIVDSNAAGGNPKLNFKGFAVGNPYTDPYSGTPAMVDTYWGHQLVPKPSYDSYVEKCVKNIRPNRLECATLQSTILNGVGNLNPYALDYPVCTKDSSRSRSGHAQQLWQLHHQLKAVGIEPASLRLKSMEEYEPCEDNYMNQYLNRPEVKTALHVKSNTMWMECSYTIHYNTTDRDVVSTAPIYNYLINGGYGLNILVYSGDDDSICATIGTQSWIWNLGYTPAADIWSVYTVDQQTAGYLTKWENTKLAFLTIHRAGHEVPTYVPAVALDMFKRYLAGEFTNA
jgi:carboxypeptidase C (cathepsin A)